MARTDILDTLDESYLLVTQDWAMKFLPQKYRESQSDWFGKRGISWHISVVVRKKHGVLQSQSFVHIAERQPFSDTDYRACSSDSQEGASGAVNSISPAR